MNQDQTPQPGRGTEWWGQFLVFFAVLAVLLLVLISNTSGEANEPPASADEGGTVRVFFREPADNAVVSSPFTVVMGAEGLTVEPAGEVHEGAGHLHVMIDEDFVDPGETIPNDATHLHFGDGSTTTTLELPPGPHILRLQFANGAHIALEGDQYRDEISITVEE